MEVSQGWQSFHRQCVLIWGHKTSRLDQKARRPGRGKSYLPKQKSKPFWKLCANKNMHQEEKEASCLEPPHPDMRSLSPPVSCHWRDALEMLNSAETYRKGRRECSVSVMASPNNIWEERNPIVFKSVFLPITFSGVFKAGRTCWPGTDRSPQ